MVTGCIIIGSASAAFTLLSMSFEGLLGIHKMKRRRCRWEKATLAEHLTDGMLFSESAQCMSILEKHGNACETGNN